MKGQSKTGDEVVNSIGTTDARQINDTAACRTGEGQLMVCIPCLTK